LDMHPANAVQSNAAQNWTNIVTGFVNASTVFTQDGGALREVACENNGKCSTDQRAYKGIATRSLARAAQIAPIVADSLHAIINASAKGAANNCEGSGDNVACGLDWSTTNNGTYERHTAANGNLGEVLSALSAVQALLWPTIDANGTTGYLSPNTTASGSPSGTSGIDAQHTGAGATLAASFTLVMAIAFAAALSC
jgi:mannan endo-1,6-alpha-mannosidase